MRLVPCHDLKRSRIRPMTTAITTTIRKTIHDKNSSANREIVATSPSKRASQLLELNWTEMSLFNERLRRSVGSS